MSRSRTTCCATGTTQGQTAASAPRLASRPTPAAGPTQSRDRGRRGTAPHHDRRTEHWRRRAPDRDWHLPAQRTTGRWHDDRIRVLLAAGAAERATRLPSGKGVATPRKPAGDEPSCAGTCRAPRCRHRARRLSRMRETDETLQSAYQAFNSRNIDAALKLMHPDVDWPNAWEGGRLVGHQAVNDYWTRNSRRSQAPWSHRRSTTSRTGRSPSRSPQSYAMPRPASYSRTRAPAIATGSRTV